MSFIFWTAWIVVIAIMVNIAMEHWHNRRAEHYVPPRDEDGSIQILSDMPRHRR